MDRIISITKFDKDSAIAQRICEIRLDIIDIIHSEKQTKEFIDRCVLQIETPVIKHSLIQMAMLIAKSDNEYSAEEQKIIAYLTKAISDTPSTQPSGHSQH